MAFTPPQSLCFSLHPATLPAVNVLAFASPALAADFTLTSDTTTTNDGVTLDGGDSLTITEGTRVTLTGQPGGPAIQTTGSLSHGVYVGQTNSSVSNSGQIRATGENADALRFDVGDATVINSGALRADQGNALTFLGATNSLTLEAPAYILGGMSLGLDSTVVINTGQSQSFQWTFSGAAWTSMTVTADVPLIISGSTVASIDPTQFSASQTGMTGLSSLAFDLATGPNSAGAGPASSSSKTPALLSGSTIGHGPTRRSWASGFGQIAQFGGQGASLPYSQVQAGMLGGMDWTSAAGGRFGIFAGAAAGAYAADAIFMRSHRIQSLGGLVGFYGQQSLGAMWLDFGLVGGFQTNDSQRAINNNLLPGGIDTARASYGSGFVAPHLKLSRAWQLASNLTLTTSASLGYTAGFVDAYSETATAATASFNQRRFGIGTGAADVKLARQFGQTTLTGHVGLLAETGFGDETLSGTLLGQPWSHLKTASTAVAGQAGLGIRHQFGTNFIGSLSAETSFGAGGLANTKGSARLRFRF